MPTSAPRHGALLQRDGQTRFSLWAPDAREVSVELAENPASISDGNTSIRALQSHPNGWFSALLPYPAGTAYRFVIDGELRVPDPASRAQLEDIEGFSQVVDPHAWQWQCNSWLGRPWHEAVIYEVHVGLFGGFNALRERLPALQHLGITAIELMPLGAFPGARNWGYDGVLPFAPDSSMGSPDDLRALIDSAHSLGLMVYVDVVYNHFGPAGNYLGQYASSFFRNDIQTPWGAAIDFRRREVRNFYCENALMWVQDYRVDGLRFDAAHAIGDNRFLTDLATRLRHAVGERRHLHLILENENNSAELLEQGFDAQWNDDGHNVLHALLTGEREGYYADFCDAATEKLARCLAEGFVYQGDVDRRGEPRGEPSAHLPPTAFVLFLQNHDQVGNRALGERLTRLAAREHLRAATALLLLSPMIPLLFMGEEWGTRHPFLYFTDHQQQLAEAVYAGRKREFAEFSRFQAGTAENVLPDPNDPETFRRCQLDPAECLQEDHRDWHSLYSELLALRARLITPRLPGSRSAGAVVLGDGAVSARWQLGDGSLLRIAINLGGTAVDCSTADAVTVLYAYRADASAGSLLAGSVLATLQEAA